MLDFTCGWGCGRLRPRRRGVGWGVGGASLVIIARLFPASHGRGKWRGHGCRGQRWGTFPGRSCFACLTGAPSGCWVGSCRAEGYAPPHTPHTPPPTQLNLCFASLPPHWANKKGCESRLPAHGPTPPRPAPPRHATPRPSPPRPAPLLPAGRARRRARQPASPAGAADRDRPGAPTRPRGLCPRRGRASAGGVLERGGEV